MKNEQNQWLLKWSSMDIRWKVALLVGLVLVLVFPLAMCNGSQPTDAIPEVEEPEIDDIEVIEEPIEDPKEPQFRAPLTNEGIEQPIDKRPYAILVENSPQARPQSGLDQADIVYEVLAEGSITRFIAIYQSQFPDIIGPIRSAREYMLDIAGDYDAVIVHAGGSPAALDRIRREQLPSLSEIVNGAYFIRESFRKAPHNVYSNVELLDKGVEARKYRQTYILPTIPYTLDLEKELIGQEAMEVTIPYSSGYQVKYRYNEHTETFNRFINNMPHADFATNQQLQAKNVFVAYARHNVLDREGRLNVNVQASGKGFALQQGIAREITWRYEDGMMRFYTGGQEVERYPGNTWIQIVPDIVAVTIQE